MRVVVFGYHDVGYNCLREIFAQRDEVAAVFTHEDDPHENIWFHSVAECARQFGAPVYTPENPNSPEWIAKLRELQPDILFSFYYRRLLGPEILSIPPRGGLNMHGSLLPRNRGRAPVNWALVRGDAETGVTLHYMVAKADAGDIVAQKVVPINFEDTALTLSYKIAAAAREVMHATLPQLRAGTAPRTPQDLSQGNYCRKRTPEDGRIDWCSSALAIYNLVRAVTHPYPGAFTDLAGLRLFVWQAHPIAGEAPGARPGQVVLQDLEGRTAHVQTGAGLLRVERIQLDGEPEVEASVLPAGTLLGTQSR